MITVTLQGITTMQMLISPALIVQLRPIDRFRETQIGARVRRYLRAPIRDRRERLCHTNLTNMRKDRGRYSEKESHDQETKSVKVGTWSLSGLYLS